MSGLEAWPRRQVERGRGQCLRRFSNRKFKISILNWIFIRAVSGQSQLIWSNSFINSYLLPFPRYCDLFIMPPTLGYGALSDDACLTSVCLSVSLSHTSGLSGKQRSLGRLKLAQRYSRRHTWLGHHFQGKKVKGQLAGAGAYYGGLLLSLLHTDLN